MMAITMAAIATSTRMNTMPAEAVIRLGGDSFGSLIRRPLADAVPNGRRICPQFFLNQD
jgi:hypothetical protein